MSGTAPSTSTVLKVVGCVVGVVGSLLVYGILQERIMTRPYGEGEDAEYFKFSVFLVMNNRCVSMLVAVVVLAVLQTAVAPVAPIYKYAAVSASNVVATTCQYEALKYVSFPVQTLGKCAKMIPVMIWGYAINGRDEKKPQRQTTKHFIFCPSKIRSMFTRTRACPFLPLMRRVFSSLGRVHFVTSRTKHHALLASSLVHFFFFFFLVSH